MAIKRTPEPREPEHVSQLPFGKLLEQFVGASDGGGMSPYSGGGMSISPATLNTTKKSSKKEKEKERPSAGDSLDIIDEDGLSLSLDDMDALEDTDELGYNEDFDDLIEGIFEADEDVTLRNSLIAMGRKYAIKGAEEEGETSEVTRAFVRQEQAIGELFESIGADEVAIQRDIELLRAQRTRNIKGMADMLAVKGNFHRLKLDLIKEQNNIANKKFDITMKMRKEKNEDATDSGIAATQAVQRLLSIGRSNVMPDDEDEIDLSPSDQVPQDDSRPAASARTKYHDGTPETMIHLASDIPDATTDGDKFIQHEDEGVEYVLDINTEDDTRQIYAVDKYGNVVEGYPMPSNPNQLKFQLNELAGEATDQLMRTYRLRRNGEDVMDGGSPETEEADF